MTEDPLNVIAAITNPRDATVSTTLTFTIRAGFVALGTTPCVGTEEIDSLVSVVCDHAATPGESTLRVPLMATNANESIDILGVLAWLDGTASDDVQIEIRELADLSLSLQRDPDPEAPRMVIEVRNLGPQDASGVRIFYDVEGAEPSCDAGCKLTDLLGAGEAGQMSVTLPSGANAKFEARVAAASPEDPVLANNSASITFETCSSTDVRRTPPSAWMLSLLVLGAVPFLRRGRRVA